MESSDFFVGMAQQALWITALAAAPILIPALLAGLLLGMIQAATSINEQTLVFQLGDDEQTQFLSDEFLPVQLDESQVVGDTAILNDGDADSYPVLTLTGPCAVSTSSQTGR